MMEGALPESAEKGERQMHACIPSYLYEEEEKGKREQAEQENASLNSQTRPQYPQDPESRQKPCG